MQMMCTPLQGEKPGCTLLQQRVKELDRTVRAEALL
jgi:hypothetical protein